MEKGKQYHGFSTRQNERLYEAQGGTCAFCRVPFDEDEMQSHHKRPRSKKGGGNGLSNGVKLCKACHAIFDPYARSGWTYEETVAYLRGEPLP